ncbi:MAG: murein biosynthesis integral membrane protein MurJ, partial [Gammaproteobacteria bacterium]|nr:murein biosynthesis integral membrane protein MurJ [Gammaproteobacteria bacterium]
FAVPAFTPVLLNLCLIVTAVWVSPYFEQPVIALAWGVAVAGITQLLFQFPFLLKLKLMPRPRYKKNHQGVSQIIRLMIPAIIGSSVAQINLLFDTIIASFLVAGSVSWLYYSDRLVEFPLGILGIALATVILPSLSKHHARKSKEEFNQTLDWALRLVLLVAIPAATGLLLLAGPLLATLFNYGEFNLNDAEMASMSLMAYALGLPAFVIIKILAPGYYARQDTKTPVRIAIKSMIANMFLNVLFVVPMVLLSIPGPHTGLALATSASAYMNAWLLYRGLRQQNIYTPRAGWGAHWFYLLGSNLIMAGFLFYFSPQLTTWNSWLLSERITYLLGFVILAACIYFITLFLLGLRPKHIQK